MKCVGNCAICKLDVDKVACCQVQTFRQTLEVKRMLKQLLENKPDAFSALKDIESEGIGEIGLDAPGTIVADETVSGGQ